MKRLGRRWRAGILLVGLVVPVIGWWVTRPRVPISFIGTPPPGRFIFKSEFSGKPMFDFTLPGGRRFAYPEKETLAQEGVDPDSICGYWEPDSVTWLRARYDFRAGAYLYTSDARVFLPISFIQSSPERPLASGSPLHGSIIYLPPGHPIVAIPFATHPDGVRSVLEIGSQRSSIRLPLREDLGSKGRKPSVAKAGPYEVRISPRKWMWSVEDLSFNIQVVDAPPQHIFRIDYSAASTRFPWQNSTEFKEMGLLTWPRTESGKLQGTLSVYAPTRAKLKLVRRASTVDLLWPDGEVAWSSQYPEKGKNRGFLAWAFRGHEIRPGADPIAIRNVLRVIESGTVLDVSGHKHSGSFQVEMNLDVPTPFRDVFIPV